MLTMLTAIAALAAVYLIAEAVLELIGMWGSNHTISEQAQVEMSETDEKMIRKTQEVLKECFGEDVMETFRNASNVERINMMNLFAKRLQQEYGLDDIEVDVMVTNEAYWGYYSWNDKKAKFNIFNLTVDGDNKNFEYCVKESLDTVIHELRHAVQHKAIHEEGFWNVGEERRVEWATNMQNYVQASVNMQAYISQPVEADAFTFAARSMEGVC